MIKVSLDSNTYTSYVNGDSLVSKELEKSNIVYISTIVLGELFAAFKKGKKERENLGVLQDFLAKPTVEILTVEKETAKIYGQVRSELEKTGNPIPANDIWISTTVVESGSVLITYDKHFLKIPGLRVWDRLKS